MAIHYNLTILNDKLSNNDEQSFVVAIDFFVNILPIRFKVLKVLIDKKKYDELCILLPEIIEYLIDFGVLQAHQDGEDLLKWVKNKGKRKEAFILYNSLSKNYKLAKKEIEKDYQVNQIKTP